ncbi:MAG: NADH-quinone oxidoreductase subunit C [Candidatus Odinarchaeota archaeon]|nr:NADH-quinone oxidoreductase subunit C [Candidatus Odinarchaeota archaeon]
MSREETPKNSIEILSKEESILNRIEENFGDSLEEKSIQCERRIFIRIKRESLLDLLRFLKDNWDYVHLSTITALDKGKDEDFQLIYHLVVDNVVLNVKVDVPKSEPKITTIKNVMRAAEFYEMEINDLFGITFLGNEKKERFILPDDWPEGVYPLRKDS